MEENNKFADNLVPESGYIRKGKNFWLIKINFAPFEYRDQMINANLAINDAELGAESVYDLVGKEFVWDEKYFRSGADASFYVYEHDYIKSLKVKFGEIKDGFIGADVETIIEFTGTTIDDADENMKLQFRVDLEIKE